MGWLNRVVLDNTLLRWFLALATAGGLTLLGGWLRAVLVPRLRPRATRTGTLRDQGLAGLVARTRLLLLMACALSLGGQFLALPGGTTRALDLLPGLALILQLGAWGHWGVGLWLERRWLGRSGGGGHVASRAAVAGFLLRLGLWSLVLVAGLDALGFNVTTLLASLGIGGIAVALAVQNLLGDLFASLSITLDQPFVAGEFIALDNGYLGTVERIGLKSTRIRSLSGELVVIGNGDLLKSRIRNYASMPERRVLFQFTLSHPVTPEQAGQFPDALRGMIQAQPRTRFDRAHLAEFSDTGLRFEVVYYVLDADYNRYMDIQHAVNLGLLAMVQALGLGFAVPRILGAGAAPVPPPRLSFRLVSTGAGVRRLASRGGPGRMGAWAILPSRPRRPPGS